MNKAAQALGRLAKGVPKNFSADELERRRKRMAAINERKAKASKAMKIKTKIINGVTFKRFKELNQTRAMWHAVIAGRIRASYDTIAECRDAAKCVRYSR